MFDYDSFTPGEGYGIAAYTLDEGRCRDWCAIEGGTPPDAGTPAPLGMIVLVQQAAMNRLLSPRPPGNVQAEQTFELRARPVAGQTLFTEVGCLAKEIRRDRRRVSLEFRIRDRAGILLVRAVNVIVMAS